MAQKMTLLLCTFVSIMKTDGSQRLFLHQISIASMAVSYIHEVNCVVVHQSKCNHELGACTQLL